jgi:hypothetical protein
MSTHATRSFLLILGAVLAGCGDDGAPPAITVTGRGGPMAGVSVVFHDASGAAVVTERTDSSGRAAGDIGSGGMVTVLLQDAEQRLRATFMDVARGDELTLLSPMSHAPEIGTAYVSIAPYTGATFYEVRTACGTTGTSDVSQPVALAIDAECMAADGTLPLVVTAFGALNSMIGVSAVRSVPWTNPMNVTMPDWRPPALYAVDATRVPAGATGVVGGVAQVANGVRIDGESETVGASPGGGASFSLPYVPGFGDAFVSHVGVYFGASGVDAVSVQGESTLVHQTTVPPARRTVDLTADLLPRLPTPSYDRSVADRPVLTWAPQTGLEDTDAAVAVVAWREGEGPYDLWVILAPADIGARVQVPALPAELASWGPTAFVAMDLGAVAFVDADWLTSYTQVRREAGLDFLFDDQQSLLPASGDAVVRMTAGGARL